MEHVSISAEAAEGAQGGQGGPARTAAAPGFFIGLGSNHKLHYICRVIGRTAPEVQGPASATHCHWCATSGPGSFVSTPVHHNGVVQACSPQLAGGGPGGAYGGGTNGGGGAVVGGSAERCGKWAVSVPKCTLPVPLM